MIALVIDEHDVVTSTPILNTKGLMLLPVQHGVQDYSRWLNDPEVVKFSELRHRQHTWEDCQKYIASFDGINNHMWTMNAIGANVHIGNITLHVDPYNSVGQMGILIGEKWAWGRRYGIEAWKAVMAWAKETKIRRLECGCRYDNIGMRKMATKTMGDAYVHAPHHFMVMSGDKQELHHKSLFGINL